MVQRLYGETEGQTGAFHSFGRDWMSVYSTPFSNHFGPLNLFDFFPSARAGRRPRGTPSG